MSAMLRAGEPHEPDMSEDIAAGLEATASQIAEDAPDEISDEVEETVGFYRSLRDRLAGVETQADLDEHVEATLSESVRLEPTSRVIFDFTDAHCEN